jgi:hypothetical protein
MTDMRENRVPLGLLTTAERRRLDRAARQGEDLELLCTDMVWRSPRELKPLHENPLVPRWAFRVYRVAQRDEHAYVVSVNVKPYRRRADGTFKQRVIARQFRTYDEAWAWLSANWDKVMHRYRAGRVVSAGVERVRVSPRRAGLGADPGGQDDHER